MSLPPLEKCDKAQNHASSIKGLLSYVHKGRIHADINQLDPKVEPSPEDFQLPIPIFNRFQHNN